MLEKSLFQTVTAKASADAGDPPGEKNIVRLELLSLKRTRNGNSPGYFIELNADGNEVHRVVLMDGTVENPDCGR